MKKHRKLDATAVIGIVGLFSTLLLIMWLVNGGVDKLINHNLQQIEAIINSL